MDLSLSAGTSLTRERRRYDKNYMYLQLCIGALIFVSGAISTIFAMLLRQEIIAGADEMTIELIGTGIGSAIAIIAIRVMVNVWKKDRERIRKLEDERYTDIKEDRDRWRRRALNDD